VINVFALLVTCHADQQLCVVSYTFLTLSPTKLSRFYFWLRIVVKRGICYQNVCPSVWPSILHTRQSCTPKRFKILQYALHRTI